MNAATSEVVRSWQLVVCDVDGTLLDSTASVIAAVRDTMLACGVAPAPDDELARCIGPPLHESLAGLLGENEDVHAALEVFRRSYRDHAPALTTPVHGALEAVAALRGAGIRVAACTYTPGPVAVAMLDRAGFGELFELVVGALPSGVDHRMKHELLKETLDLAGVPAAAALYVGDHDLDEHAAKAAGMAFARVGPGFQTWSDVTQLVIRRV